MGARYVQALKTASLCAIFALSGMGLLAQAQEAPKPPVAARPKPSTEELERWRRMIVHTERPKKACFTAQYPARHGSRCHAETAEHSVLADK